MHSYTVTFVVEAPARKVWRVLHPPPPADATLPRVIEYPAGSMEILNEGDEAGQGLVRTCVFSVPRYLLSGGKARSWETVTDDSRVLSLIPAGDDRDAGEPSVELVAAASDLLLWMWNLAI